MPHPSISTGIRLPHRVNGGVLLPILGSSYGEALEQGQIELHFDPQEGSFSAWYYEHRLPITPERYSEMLRVIVAEAEGTATTEAGRKILELAARYTGLHRPNRSGSTGIESGAGERFRHSPHH